MSRNGDGRTIAGGLARMKAVYERQPFGDTAVIIFAEQLSDLPDTDVYDAIDRLIRTSVYMPTIADIRREVIETRLRLPTAEEAWEQAVDGTATATEVISAVKAIGGPWTLKHTTKPEVVRGQFMRFYSNRRANTIREEAAADPITAKQLLAARARAAEGPPAVASLNGRRVEQLPVSTRIRPRPVVLRMAARYGGRVPGDPSADEMHDAILLLRDGPQGVSDPADDPLYREAERVMIDADRAAR